MQFEETILRNLISNAEYRDKVLPNMKSEFFHDPIDQMVFDEIRAFVMEYKDSPSREALALLFSGRGDLNEESYGNVLKKVKSVTKDTNTEKNLEFLVKTTEQFAKDKAAYNVVMSSIDIIEGRDKTRQPSAIPEMMREALSISFDTDIGHDYMRDSDKRFEFYTRENVHIPCDLHFINKITNGGVSPATLNMAMADTNVGKTGFMCHMSAAYLDIGLNVLYISLEEEEEMIGKRIDANLLDINMQDFKAGLDKGLFDGKIARLRARKHGVLKIRKFEAGGCHAGHIRQLLDEYKIRENWKPDVIMLDYIALMSCERWKAGSVRHDLYLQFIAEEVRNIGHAYKVPLWSGYQSNRDGAETTEAGKKNVADSYGVLRTADLFFVMMTSEELMARGQILFKQLKSRYGPTDRYARFVIGFDKDKQRFHDVEDHDQTFLDRAATVVEESDKMKNMRSKNKDRLKSKQGKKNGFVFN